MIQFLCAKDFMNSNMEILNRKSELTSIYVALDDHGLQVHYAKSI